MKLIAIHLICDGERTIQPGEEAEFDKKTADSLIESGAAEVVAKSPRTSKAKADDDLGSVVAE